ncbi:hypothetical protein T484DRAFT_1619896 [Baffinella frigidus]|nr:hypothetical protein T484DRAFT_1619896 [Cryptophyta sp. CCMP2293]
MNLEDVSPATRLLEKRRQMFEVQEALETQKEEFARREELFKRREEALRKQDLELQQQLIRFNKFLQENDSKTARAEKKAAEEIKLREQKEREIQELTVQAEELTKSKDQKKAELDKNLVYEKYLLAVLEESDDFVEIQDILKRYQTLQVTSPTNGQMPKWSNVKVAESAKRLTDCSVSWYKAGARLGTKRTGLVNCCRNPGHPQTISNTSDHEPPPIASYEGIFGGQFTDFP